MAGRTRGQIKALKKAFLEIFRVSANVSGSARALKLDRDLIYKWKKEDPAFLAAFESAEAESVEVLEQAAFSRAVDGVTQEKPIIDRKSGEQIGSIIETRYSDVLLMFLLKARVPHKYREKHIGGSDDQPLVKVVSQEEYDAV